MRGVCHPGASGPFPSPHRPLPPSVTLLNQPFTANGAQQNIGQDYLVAGAGLNFQFTPPRFGVLLNYQGQFFRESVQARYVGLRAGFTF